MKKIIMLSAVCIVLTASAWAQRGPGGGMEMGRGMGMGPGPMGRGPAEGPMFERPVPPVNELPQLDVRQPAPGPRMNRPQGNPQEFQDIPPMVREWLRNGGMAILREKFAQRMQMGQGPRAGMGMKGQMKKGVRGRDGQGPGSERGRMLNQPRFQPDQKIGPRSQPGMRGQGPMQGRGRGMGGMGMMRGFGGPMQDQPQDVVKFRSEIKRFDGLKEKGEKGDQPKAKRDKAGKDQKETMSKGKKKADKEDEGDDDEEDEDEKDDNR